jgi:hypothetical protein
MASSNVGVTDPPDVGSNKTPDVAPTMKLLSLQRNWKQEITIEGKVVAIFMPGETKAVEAWIPAHRDFEAIKDYFVVQEVL